MPLYCQTCSHCDVVLCPLYGKEIAALNWKSANCLRFRQSKNLTSLELEKLVHVQVKSFSLKILHLVSCTTWLENIGAEISSIKSALRQPRQPFTWILLLYRISIDGRKEHLRSKGRKYQMRNLIKLHWLWICRNRQASHFLSANGNTRAWTTAVKMIAILEVSYERQLFWWGYSC